MGADESGLFIDGARRAPHGTDRITVVDPSTEEVYGSVPDGDDVDVDVAVGAARRAFESSEWRDLDPSARADALERIADALTARAETIGEVVSHENGMPLGQSIVVNSHVPAGVFRYYANLVRSLDLEEVRPFGDDHTLVRRVPVGVAGLIAPWNYPQVLLAHKLAPALGIGCTVVVKPAGETPLDAYILADAIQEAGLPDGVVNIVTGGPETGRHLVRHKGVDKVAFTGSTAVGREIAAVCGADLRRVSLELGGKSAAIVLEDADLEEFAAQAVETCLPNTGQTCFASTRVLAPRDRYEEVVELLVEALKSAVTGDPFDPTSTFGPLVSKRQQAKVLGYIAIGEDEGAKAVLGGTAAQEGMGPGYYVAPTVFRDASNSMRIAQEEIFGPVVVVIAYDGDDEAISLANDSPYGLGGSVFSADVDHATAVARRIVTGSIGVNAYQPSPVAPFGGRKASGIGRELGPEGLAPYLEYQSIYRFGPAT